MNHRKTVGYLLGILLLIIAINAFAGGYYGMMGANAVPIEWLKDGPFTSYFIPGLVLFAGIGGLSLFASISVLKQSRIARHAAILSGLTILLWIGVQIMIIGPVSWLQPVTAVAGALVLVLALRLPENPGH